MMYGHYEAEYLIGRQGGKISSFAAIEPLSHIQFQGAWKPAQQRLIQLQLQISKLNKEIAELETAHCDTVIPPHQSANRLIWAAIVVPLFMLFVLPGSASGALLAGVAYIGFLAWHINNTRARTRKAMQIKRIRLGEMDSQLWAKRHLYLRNLERVRYSAQSPEFCKRQRERIINATESFNNVTSSSITNRDFPIKTRV